MVLNRVAGVIAALAPVPTPSSLCHL
jgi:hypothetical protein